MFIPQLTPIQPINVIVQQPHEFPGWIIAILSAFAGAILTMGTEYLRGYIDGKMIKEQLNDEFLINFNRVLAASRVLDGSVNEIDDEKSHALMTVKHMLSRLKRDRFDLYFGNQKATVYELDKKQNLSDFYATLAQRPEGLGLLSLEHIEWKHWIDRVVRIGQRFVDETGVSYTPWPDDNEDVYLQLRRAGNQGRRDAGVA
jgi:hypothetical protein